MFIFYRTRGKENAPQFSFPFMQTADNMSLPNAIMLNNSRAVKKKVKLLYRFRPGGVQVTGFLPDLNRVVPAALLPDIVHLCPWFNFRVGELLLRIIYAFQKPGHVFAQDAHYLEAFCVLFRLFSVVAVD